jgi:signal peptide peptidase SppA
MSEPLARDIVARINRAALFHSGDHIDVLASNLRQLAVADPKVEGEAWQARKVELVSAYGLPNTDQRKPFAFSSGRAVIPIHGTLINRFSASWGFITGYNFIRNQMAAAVADPEVSAIVLDVNSFGGMCAGCAETADAIHAARSIKPVLGVVDAHAYSAGYMLASAASRLIVTPTGGVGSIGVVATHTNMGKMLEQFGIEVTFIHAGAKKVDGNPYEKLSDRARANIQREVDAQYDIFVAQVVRNRRMKDDEVRGTEAGTFNAAEAKSLGLCDAVAAPTVALAENDLPTDDSNVDASAETTNPQHKEGDVPHDNKQPAAPDATALAEAKTAERARVNGILGHAEAKGRDALARHLALETDLSVEAAANILKASPVEKTEEPKKETGAGAFADAMNKDRNPNLSAGDGKTEDGDPVALAASRLLTDYTAATGFTPPEAAKRH